MKKNSFLIKFTSTIFCITFAIIQAPCLTNAKPTLSGLNKEQSKINSELKKIKSGLSAKENYKSAIEHQIKEIQNKIDNENKKLDEINSVIEEKQNSINGIQADIDSKYAQLKKRVCAIYKAGDTSLIEILMESKNFTDLMDKADFIQKISKYDQDIINSLNLDIQKVASEKAIIEENKKQIDSIVKNLDENKSKLEQAEKENQKNIQELKNSQNQKQSRLKQIESEKRSLESQISNYTKNQNTRCNVIYKSGRYIWPAPSCHVITSPYGPRWGSFHSGIDISGGGAYGSPIVAACDGVVIKANSTNSWGSGWGYHVMIDHGNGYATLYAHCSTVNVRVGQQVKGGQVIARIGNTGHSFGAHLHFETWHNGRRYNPSSEL